MTWWRRVDLRFPDRDLERTFWDGYIRSNLPQIRVAVGIGLCLYASFGILIRVRLEVPTPDTILRFGIAIPMILAVFAMSPTAFFRRHWQVLMGVTLYTAITVIVVGWSLTDGYPLIWNLSGTLVLLAFTFSFSRIGSRVAITVGIAAIVTYVAVVAASGELDPIDLAYAAFFLVAMVTMGGMTSYLLERSARRIFVQDRELAAERERSEQLLLTTFPHAIVDRLKEGEAIADSNPEVTVLFADLVDFTAHAATLTPEAVVDVLGEVFARLDELTSALGLEKIKTVGDAYMVVAGAPEAREDHVEAAADLAVRIVEEIPRLRWPNGEPIGVRVGMATGPVVSGVIGQQRFAYDLWGATVNLASRLETNGAPGRVLVSDAMHERLRGWRFGEPRDLDLKGMGPTRAWILLGRDEAATGSVPSGGPLAQSGRATDS